VPIGSGTVPHLVHLEFSVAVHWLLVNVPFGHSVHGVQFVPLLWRNVLFVHVNEH
jgi:hypothetical protein